MKQLDIDSTGAYATTRNTCGTVAQHFIPRDVVQWLDIDGMRADGWRVTDYRLDGMDVPQAVYENVIYAQ